MLVVAMANSSSSPNSVPVLYNKCSPYSGFAKFNVHKIEPSSQKALQVQGECSQVDHIFCGTRRDPDYTTALTHGDCFQVHGGTLECIKVEKEHSTFHLTHDGISPEVLIIYGTKHKNT